MEALARAAEPERASAAAALSAATGEAIRASGRGLDLAEADFMNFDLHGANLSRATLNRTVFHGTNLHGADLSEATMVCPGMERTNLFQANLRGAYVHALAMQTCNLEQADLRHLRDAAGSLFHGCKMRGANLDKGHLCGTTFYQCDLSLASLRGANLQGANANECLFDRADLAGSLVDQLTVTKCSMRSTSLAGARGADCCLQRLTCADGLVLEGASLPHLRLGAVRARGWRAAGLTATAADLIDVSVEEADLENADLSNARIHRCCLPGVNLNGAILNGASVTSSSMRRATLVAARAENLQIVESDLAEADASLVAGRCLVARDVDLAGALFVNANLYRAMLTGDPPEGMSLKGAVLDGAILVQAYIAADLSDAHLLNVNAAYSRFSQSNLRGARLNRANMHQSTWVKVDATGACLAGVNAPVFIDRCKGLQEAVGSLGQDETSDLGEFAHRLHVLLTSARHGST